MSSNKHRVATKTILFLSMMMLPLSAAFADVTISGNVGVAGATLSFGTDSTATADGSGDYTFDVPDDWIGTVTPSSAGYTFTPTHIDYTNILVNQSGQDYAIATLTISGNAGVAGADLDFGTDSTVAADGSGDYSLVVPYDWIGTVTPSKAGYTFNPTHIDFTNVILSQSGQDFALATITISGNAGVAGADLDFGTDSTVAADGSGDYSLVVPYDWIGTVTPSKVGYTFAPTHIDFTNVVLSQSGQDFVATAITYTISGNAGHSGVTLSYTDGSAKTATSQADSTYSFTVSYNWSGTVTPTKTGFTFAPTNRTFTNVLANQTNSDYVATAITYTISGNAGHSGVTLSYTDGSAKTATSQADSTYSFTVSYNWSGTVTPTKTGFTFAPTNRTFTNVLANQTNSDYVATAITYTISGNAGHSGVTLSYTDGSAKTATSQADSTYSFTVSYNWSGTVTPTKTGYVFTPTNRTFTNVLANQANSNYVATAITYTISGNAGHSGVTLSYTDGTAQTATSLADSTYSFTVSYNWSGTVTPSKTGFVFTPTNRTFTNVLANQTNSNYVATAITYTISGNAGSDGVTLSYTDGSPKTATSDTDSTYSFTVSYNWSGTVTPTKNGYTFAPTSRTYTNVLASQTAQDYSPSLVLGVVSEEGQGLPKEYELSQNFPNPFNPTTVIRFTLPKSSFVSLKIYNLIGQEVTTLVNQNLPTGIYRTNWNGTDRSGAKVASGIYLYILQADSFSETRKMVLIK